jgi:fumarylacetoacetase
MSTPGRGWKGARAVTNPNDPQLESWVAVAQNSDFPIQNLPFGMFTTSLDAEPRVGVAIGEYVLDLVAVAGVGVMNFPSETMLRGSLNELFGFGVSAVRQRVSELLTSGNEELAGVADRGLVGQSEVELVLPFEIGDYVDFYSSEQHARNLGRLFRPDDEPLMPNWKHLPVGYHGRASTVTVSGTPVRRPLGQRAGVDGPTFGPSERLDIELEVGFFTSAATGLGTSVAIDDAESHIGGLVLVNDWSARDLQAWEYRPLGPFLGKSFHTTISPWVVTLDALEPFREPGPVQDPAPLGYLRGGDHRALSIDLSVELNGHRIGGTNFRDMYWTMAQQLTHASSNGTAIQTGDLYASGTVSGAEPGQYGSLIEMSGNAAEPFELPDGTVRTFLANSDSVVLRGTCSAPGAVTIGFGECAGVILPARALEMNT